MINLGRFTLGEKIVAIIFTVIIVRIVFSFILAGVQRFNIMVFLAFIGVPALWYILREEKSGDRGEIDMKPEDITRLHYEDIESLYEDTSYLHSDVSSYEKRVKKGECKDQKEASHK